MLYLHSVLLEIDYLRLIEEKPFLLKHYSFHISPLNIMDATDILRHYLTFWLCYFRPIFLVNLRETSRWCVSLGEIMLNGWNELLRLVYLYIICLVSIDRTFLLQVPHCLALVVGLFATDSALYS